MFLETFRTVFLLFLFVFGVSLANPDAKRLYDDLLSNYNRLIRPVDKNNNTVLVKLGLRLSQLIDLNLKDQILTTNVWLEHEWEDHKFRWDPNEYGGQKELYVPSEHIWLPDIVLYNNADGEYVVTTMTKAVLSYTGKVLWTPPAIFKSSCEIDVRYFPFDQQTCFLKFGSWSYDGDQIDLKHINQKRQTGDTIEVGIDLREYYPSVEWDILGVPAERHERYYPCCQEPYPDIFFNITLRRKTLFYTVNLIVPCVGISYLSVLVFYLPADSGEKIALSISILLSQTMFFLLISEIIPSTSLALPLLGKYLLFTMLLVGLSVVITIVILNVHYRKPSTHKMAPWVRKFFITKLPRLLLMRVPKDLLRDLAAQKIAGRSLKKNKFKDALVAAEQTNSNASSPDSLRRHLPGGCNGLHSTTATNRFMCRLYDGQTEHINVSEVRIDLFASKNKLVTSLPPTSAALYKHALRAAYQAGHTWGNALKPEVSTPCPSSWGWTKEKESWTPEWSAVTAIYSQLSLLDHCGCKSGCKTTRCGCRRVSLTCSAQCKSCKGGCTNQKFSGLVGALGSLGGGYNGLPSVMSGLDDSLSDVAPRKKYPFELEKAIHNVMFIQHHMQRQDEFNAEDQDWGFVAMVLDRLFLWIFTIASIVGTFAILCEAPSLYDDTKPIDMILSSVAQQQFLPVDSGDS